MGKVKEVKLRTRIKALNASRQARTASGARALGLGFVMALVSKFVGEEKPISIQSDDDATHPNLADAQPKSLFRMGHASRETLALIDASEHIVSENFASIDQRSLIQPAFTINSSHLLNPSFSISAKEIEELIYSENEDKVFLSVVDGADTEFTQSNTVLSLGQQVRALKPYLISSKTKTLTAGLRVQVT